MTTNTDRSNKSAGKHVITVLQAEGWGNAERAVALIQQFADEIELPVSFEYVVIKTADEARSHRFAGSPSIRIHGRDVEPRARLATEFGFSWRLAVWTQDAAKTEQMLRNAFVEAGWIKA